MSFPAFNTPIDWKGNAARRREYAEADRRKRGVIGLIRRLGFCFVGDEFWEEKKGRVRIRKGGSVRRYRLDLPDDDDDDDDYGYDDYDEVGEDRGR